MLNNEIKFGTQLFYSNSYEFVRKKIIAANRENWDSIWLPDHLSGIPGGTIDDFLTLWPMFGSFIELTKGKTFGSAVTDPHRYHPAVLGQMATTINHMNGGNFILGIGAGEGMNLKAYNIPYDHALGKMRESIQLMKLFWKKGKRVTFNGKYYQTKKAVLLPKPISEIPVWVAANSPKTREMTAEIADGWMPLGVITDVFKEGRNEIAEVIKKEGREIDKFTFAVFHRIYLNNDEKRISEQINALKMTWVFQPSLIKKLGFWKDEFDELYCEATGYNCDEMSLLQIDREDVGKFDINKLSTINDQIPDKMIRENTLIGTKEEIIKKIQNYIDAGAQYFIFEIWNSASSKNAPFTYWDVSQIISDEIIPFFKKNG
ncbi:MAG: LLM class flavin-dependent oxidoreductase [Candidatus Hodarchaeota archaeon]